VEKDDEHQSRCGVLQALADDGLGSACAGRRSTAEAAGILEAVR